MISIKNTTSTILFALSLMPQISAEINPAGKNFPSITVLETTADLASRIRTNLQSEKSLSTYGKNIQVSVSGNNVTLSGVVFNLAEKNKVESIVRKVSGVNSVTNKLTVQKK